MGIQGVETGKFGEWLREHLNGIENGSKLMPFYDHGNSAKSKDVKKIHGFCGEYVTNLNRLTEIDVLVAAAGSPHTDLLIEIEEREARPKKVLGDILPLMMCNRCAIKVKEFNGVCHHYFNITPETRLIVAGIVSCKGDGLPKIDDTIQPRLHQMTGLPGGLNPQRVELIFRSEINDTMEAVRQRCKKIISELLSHE